MGGQRQTSMKAWRGLCSLAGFVLPLAAVALELPASAGTQRSRPDGRGLRP
jgi:hypothetical protein